VELLEQHGIQVIFPEEQTCCGQPAFNAGYRDEARVLARRFLGIFGPLVASGTVDAVVAPSGSCVTMTSHFYDALFDLPETQAERAQAKLLADVTFELTEFLVDVLGVSDVGAAYAGKVTYHACCHLNRELGVDAQPRALLGDVDGAEIVEMADDQGCCGFGGLFAVKNAPISTAMGDVKTRNIGQSGAHVVALCDVSCMTHINGLLSRQGSPVRAVHMAELLTGRVTPPEATEETTSTPDRRDRRWQDMRQAENAETAPASAPDPASERQKSSAAATQRDRRWQDLRQADESAVAPRPSTAPGGAQAKPDTSGNPSDNTPDAPDTSDRPRRWQDIG
jgi:L-lactate dehydrogenase complex protein LldE